MWVQLRREVSREKFDDATVLFLFEGRDMHLPVLREICGFVLGTSIPVIIGAIPDRGDISLDGLWVFVVAECSVYGLFPGVCKCPDVVECM